MTTQPRRRETAAWETMTPWEKAAQWHAAAPHIADEVMLLAKEHAQHQWKLEIEKARHDQKMDVRLWVTQIVALLIGFLNVAVLAVVAWHYADTGNIVPGLTVFGAGTGLTIGAYSVGRAISKKRIANSCSGGPLHS